MWRCIASLGRPVDPDVHSQNPGDSSHVAHGPPPSVPPLDERLPLGRAGHDDGRHLRRRGADGVELAGPFRRHHQHRRPAGGDDSAEVAAGKQRVDRRRDGADAHGGEEDVVELDRVEHHHRHSLLRGDAEAAQPGGRGGDLVEQLGVGDACAGG